MKCLQVLMVIGFLVSSAFAQNQPPAKVKVAKVFEKEIAKTNQIVGIIDFDKRSGVSPEVSGLVEEHFIVEGSVVKKGDVLVRLNTEFIRKNIEIRKLEAEQVDIKIQNTKKNLKRYEILFKEQATSEKVYDDLEDTYKELMKEREIIRKTIEKMDIELRKSKILAPFDGLILERTINEGEWVSPNVPVCSLASIEHVFVDVSVSEDLAKYIHAGDSILFKINALEKELTGTVHTIVPVADMKTKTLKIKIALTYFPDLIQNMSVMVNVPVTDRITLKMVPRAALVSFQGKDLVYTVTEGNAKPLPINIVAYDGEYVGVDNEYIVPDMTVVIDGNDRLRPDQPVEIVNN